MKCNIKKFYIITIAAIGGAILLSVFVIAGLLTIVHTADGDLSKDGFAGMRNHFSHMVKHLYVDHGNQATTDVSDWMILCQLNNLYENLLTNKREEDIEFAIQMKDRTLDRIKQCHKEGILSDELTQKSEKLVNIAYEFVVAELNGWRRNNRPEVYYAMRKLLSNFGHDEIDASTSRVLIGQDQFNGHAFLELYEEK